MPEANKNKTKPKAKLYFGNADELAKTNNYVTPEYLQEVDKRRKDWNEFVEFLKKENVAGSANLDKSGAGLGYLKKWNKANPDKAFTQEDIKDVQYYSRNTKKETGERVNDGILGKVTSTFTFPDSKVNTYEMKNGQKVLVKSEDPNIGNYQYQADKINFGIAAKNKADVSKLPIYNKNSANTDISWDKKDATANNLLKEQTKKRSLSGQSLSSPNKFVKPLTATEYHPAVQEQLEGSYFDNNQKIVDYNQNLQQQKQTEIQQQADTRSALQKKLSTSKSKDFTKEEALDYFNETGKILPQNKVQGKYTTNKENQIVDIKGNPYKTTKVIKTPGKFEFKNYGKNTWGIASEAIKDFANFGESTFDVTNPIDAVVGPILTEAVNTPLRLGLAATSPITGAIASTKIRLPKKKNVSVRNEEFGMPTFQDENSDLTKKREGGLISKYQKGGEIKKPIFPGKLDNRIVSDNTSVQRPSIQQQNVRLKTPQEVKKANRENFQKRIGVKPTYNVQELIDFGTPEPGIEYVPVETALLPGTPAIKGLGAVGNFALDMVNPLSGVRSLKIKPKFNSEIDWAKWNADTPNYPELINEYNAIEESTKKAGTWMKNPDGSTFQGTPEQFVQQNSSNFKKAFPEGFTTGYRGAHQHIDNFANKDRSDYATFLTDSKVNAETYAGSNGLSKTYYNPNVNTSDEWVDGLYELGIPNNLPKVIGEAEGRNWRLLNYNTKIAEGAKNKEFAKRFQEELKDNKELYNYNNYDPNKKYLSTDIYANYIKNTNNPEGIAQINNVIDQMGTATNIPANTVYAIDANKVPLKSLRYNNGMFDMTNPNIYKSIAPYAIPTAIGAGALQQNQEEKQFAKGGVISNNMKKRTLKKYQYSYGGLTVTDLNKYGLGGAAGFAGKTATTPTPSPTGATVSSGLSIAGAAMPIIEELLPDKTYTDSEGNDLGSRKSVGESALSGAASGAQMGMALGPKGALVGAVVGGGYGAVKGWMEKDEMEEKRKQANFNINQRKLYNKMNTLQNWGNADVNTSQNFMFPDGGMVLNYDDPNANAELELQETFQMPDGTVGNVDGPSHENGGIAVDLPEGTRIWSDKLKHNGKTFAKHTKPITNKIAKLEKEIAKNPNNSEAKENSIALLNQQLDYYFDTQETNKQNTEMKRTLREGGMIKRADGSYSKRGLWDNIRANKGSGKKPTAEMLKQERKIRAQEKAMGGYIYAEGGINNPGFKALPEYVQNKIKARMEMGGYMYGQGGTNNPGFRALPEEVQENILNNMGMGGEIYSLGGRLMNDNMFAEGGKLPKDILQSRLEAHMSPEEADAYLDEYGKGGYTVRRSNDRKGKTHVVIGPDGTKKYFGDPKLGERSKSKYGKEAFYARHKKNLAGNPYFRAYARATWEEGGTTPKNSLGLTGDYSRSNTPQNILSNYNLKADYARKFGDFNAGLNANLGFENTLPMKPEEVSVMRPSANVGVNLNYERPTSNFGTTFNYNPLNQDINANLTYRKRFAEGGIHIKPENKGKFTAYAKSHGKGVQEMAAHIMANKEDYSPTIVKRANFAKNAAGWKHEMGGMVKYQGGGRRLNLETPTNNMEQRWVEDTTPQSVNSFLYPVDSDFDMNNISEELYGNYGQALPKQSMATTRFMDQRLGTPPTMPPVQRVTGRYGEFVTPQITPPGTGVLNPDYKEFNPFNKKEGARFSTPYAMAYETDPNIPKGLSPEEAAKAGMDNLGFIPKTPSFFDKAGQFVQNNPGLVGQLGTAALTAGVQSARVNRLARPRTLADVRLKENVANPYLVDYSAERNAIDRAALNAMGEAQRGFGSSAAAQAFKNKARLNQLEGTGRSFQGQENANAQLRNQFLAARQEAAMREAMMNNEIDKYNLENVYGYDTMTTAQKNAITAMLGNTAGQTFGKQTDYANQLAQTNIMANMSDRTVLRDTIRGNKDLADAMLKAGKISQDMYNDALGIKMYGGTIKKRSFRK